MRQLLILSFSEKIINRNYIDVTNFKLNNKKPVLTISIVADKKMRFLKCQLTINKKTDKGK